MGNFSISIKRMLQNKNTVTVFGVILSIFVLYFFYTMRVKKAINPIRVPCAAEQISSGEKITESLISYRQVPPSMLDGEVILNARDIINKYAADDTVIPKGSMFFKRSVIEEEQFKSGSSWKYNVPSGWIPEIRNVNVSTTYGNSIYPGDYVDIWLKIVYRYNDDDAISMFGIENANKIRYGKLFSNVKILAVNDSAANPVFQNVDERRAPSTIIFALPEEYSILLNKIDKMQIYQTVVEIVPTNEGTKDEPGDVELVSEDIANFINQNTA